jgi:hypothetical protein
VSHRPLVLVSGLTVGDYLVWNWSLNGNHDVLALVSGLTLPPLAVACLWLFAASAARLIARYGRRSSAQILEGPAARAAAGRDAQTSTAAPPEDAPSQSGSATRSSGRLAA